MGKESRGSHRGARGVAIWPLTRRGAKLTGQREQRWQAGGKRRKSHWKDNMLPFCQGGKQPLPECVC